MSKPRPVWRLAERDEHKAAALAAGLGISPVVGQVLLNRGINSLEEARGFLACDLAQLHDPLLLKDMKFAVARILKAVALGERVVVYGDYDADGVTATALLLDTLSTIGCSAGYYIPDRLEEGYGVNRDALGRLARQGFTLVITVDCGISAVDEARYARDLGMDIIITDHHEPPEERPEAAAVINPLQKGCDYPFKALAGVGVAFKLAQSLFAAWGQRAPQGAEHRLLDLVALGTIADMVPLLGENRVLVKHGLSALAQTKRPGIRCLMEIAGIEGKTVSPGQVGFSLAPRINATGRIGDPSLAVQLLRTEDLIQARDTAVYLDGENKARQEMEAEVMAEALELLQDFNPERDKFIVLARENWHPGVIGIVASRLAERFYRPVIMIALEQEEGKGSGRSIPGFNLFEALQQCGQLLTRFGGHKQAAGLAVKTVLVEKLRLELNRIAACCSEEIFAPLLPVDVEVDLEHVECRLVEELNLLEPFGIGNPSPVLAARCLTPLGATAVGKDKGHLKLKLKGKISALDGIGFNMAGMLESLKEGAQVDAAFVPELNEFRGNFNLQAKLKDIRTSIQSTGIQRLGAKPNAWVFPLITALEHSKENKPAAIIYPFQVLAEKMEACARPMAESHGLRTELWDGEGLASGQVVFTSFEFLGRDMARLEKIKPHLGLIIADSLDPGIFGRLEVPLITTYTSRALVRAYSPDRERLAVLYKKLKTLAQGDKPLIENTAALAIELGESEEFVQTGLEIFEELTILNRKNNETKRIIHFQKTAEKLDLTRSPVYLWGQDLARRFSEYEQSAKVLA